MDGDVDAREMRDCPRLSLCSLECTFLAGGQKCFTNMLDTFSTTSNLICYHLQSALSVLTHNEDQEELPFLVSILAPYSCHCVPSALISSQISCQDWELVQNMIFGWKMYCVWVKMAAYPLTMHKSWSSDLPWCIVSALRVQHQYSGTALWLYFWALSSFQSRFCKMALPLTMLE